ncbi:hypothetical protein F2Q69_00029236 [Brassica cretica]|uniref:Uncharacterized protein n=1 Tax=Brassica cretica TaxID=69181 RepID=A0A8S9SAR2_BRACR|nr:hypothetical protein F2Q69_00029236 [Brassica cretica]
MSGHSARSLYFQVTPDVRFVPSFCVRVMDLAPNGLSTSRKLSRRDLALSWPLRLSRVVDGVLVPGARGRAAFVSSGAGVVDCSYCPLWCSTRSNNTFYSLFDPKCLQVTPRTLMDTPTPDKDLCNAKRNITTPFPHQHLDGTPYECCLEVFMSVRN